MSELMLKSNIGILPASTVLYEFQSLGGIAFSGYYVDNQKRIYENFVHEKLVFPLGDLMDCFKKQLWHGLDSVEWFAKSHEFDSLSHVRIKMEIENLLA